MTWRVLPGAAQRNKGGEFSAAGRRIRPAKLRPRGLNQKVKISMKNKIPALLMLGLLGACASQPPQSAQRAGVNPVLNCGVFPVTEYLWTDGYQKLLDTKATPDWAYPAVIGIGTATWVLVTPFAPLVDILVAPSRIGEPCT